MSFLCKKWVDIKALFKKIIINQNRALIRCQRGQYFDKDKNTEEELGEFSDQRPWPT